MSAIYISDEEYVEEAAEGAPPAEPPEDPPVSSSSDEGTPDEND